MSILPELGIVLLLALLNGFFALSEIATVAARKSLLKHRARTSSRARMALELVQHPDRILSTVQVGITLVSIVTGVAVGASLGSKLGAGLRAAGLPGAADYALPLGMFVSVALITFINITVGELVPKRIALGAPERIAAHVALPILVLARVMAPFVWVLNATSTLILRLLRLHRRTASVVSEEEIRLLVAESAEQGVLDSDERNMVSRVLRLGDRSAESVMTPRPRIAWLDTTASLAENLATLRDTPFTRYPVYRGDESDIVGILEVRSLLGSLAAPRDAAGTTRVGLAVRQEDLFRELAKPLYVPGSARALDLLEDFRSEAAGLALVVDEYGDIEGLVTVNDLLGTVVGHAPADADDDPFGEGPVVRRADGSYLLDGALSGDDLRELLGEDHLPHEDEHEFNTVAGMMIAAFGRIPRAGRHFSWHGHYFEVLDLDGARIDKVLLVPAHGEAEPPDA